MPSNVSTLLTGGVSVGILAGVVSGLFYLVVAGFRWAGEVRHFSGEWLNKQLQRHLGTPAAEDRHARCTDDGPAMDSESAQVREFIERLVESLISGGLDQVNVNRLYTHPDYKPLDESDSPSAAHADLKKLIHHVVREAMTLPALSQNGSVNTKAIQDDVSTKTYEDILATAILNKVIQRFQQYAMGSPGIDSNSNQLLASEDDHRPKFISRVEIGMASSSSIDDDASAIDDGSWSGSSHTEPMSLTIEECVEEEMTTYSSDDEGRGRETNKAELDFYLSGLKFIKKHRVPFPELGMDIVDGGEDSEEEEGEEGDATSPLPTDLVSPVDSWEDNWLFQRRRLKTLGSRDPVPMLVPNPSEDFRALIGDRDAEDISDLSDCSESALEDVLDDHDDDHVPMSHKSLTKKASLEVSLEIQGQSSTDDCPTEPQKVSASTEECRFEADHELDIVEARNTEFSNGIDSLLEFGQLDSEYTEDYTSATRRQMNSLKRHQGIATTNSKPVPRPSSSKKESARESSSDLSLESVDSVNELATPPRPGTIAEREHKKWESAVPLPNNPYSSENIMKRLNKSSVLDIRTNCQTQQEKVELPEIHNESKVEKAMAPHQGNDANITRYGRDYYINASKNSSGSRNHIARPVEIVPSSTVDRPQAEPVAKCTRVSAPPEKSPARVGSEVSRWQKEINQTEEMWLKKINGCRTESESELKSKDKTTITNGQHKNVCDKDSMSAHQTNCVDSPLKVPIGNGNKIQESVLEVSKGLTNGNKHLGTSNNKADGKVTPTSNMSNGDSSKLPSNQTNGHAMIKVDIRSSADREPRKPMNGRVKTDNSTTPSEGSISSDGEHNVSMPSVKDLAKHFTIDTTTKTKNPKPVELPNGRQVPNQLDVKRVVIRPVDGSNQPMREVHSLTARSISREFREELKRNLPSQRDRNMHSSDSSLARSDSSLDQGPSSLPRGSDFDISTTPGYTSDESNAPSPIPGTLRNNIAFWEQMQRNK